MATGDLTTLAHVKSWLGITNENSDVLLQRLITSASRFIMAYLNRGSLARTEYNEVYDGYGHDFMLLRQYPLISINSIQFGAISITQPATGNPLRNGWVITPGDPGNPSVGSQRVTLKNNCFPVGRATVQVSYIAGYQVTGEAHTIAAGAMPPAVAPVETMFTWNGDVEVTYDDGVPLTKVTGAPNEGEYAVSDIGVYTFAAADIGETVLISYSYVPPDIEQACWELVGERYQYKDRIGVKSKSLGGQETVSFETEKMSSYIAAALQPYRRVVPV